MQHVISDLEGIFHLAFRIGNNLHMIILHPIQGSLKEINKWNDKSIFTISTSFLDEELGKYRDIILVHECECIDELLEWKQLIVIGFTIL